MNRSFRNLFSTRRVIAYRREREAVKAYEQNSSEDEIQAEVLTLTH